MRLNVRGEDFKTVMAAISSHPAHIQARRSYHRESSQQSAQGPGLQCYCGERATHLASKTDCCATRAVLVRSLPCPAVQVELELQRCR